MASIVLSYCEDFLFGNITDAYPGWEFCKQYGIHVEIGLVGNGDGQLALGTGLDPGKVVLVIHL